MNESSLNRRKIITSPPNYLIIIIKSTEEIEEAGQTPLIQYEKLDLKELFAASKTDSAIFEL